MRYSWIIGAVALVGLLALFGLQYGRQPAEKPVLLGTHAPLQWLDPVQMAPDLAFTDATGAPRQLADFRGKVVLLNLWATWCPPCIKEMPGLDRLQAEFGGDDFIVLTLSLDREGMAVVEPFFTRTGIHNLVPYLDEKGAAMAALGLKGLPTTLIIDREGKVLAHLAGDAEWDSAPAKAVVESVIR